MKTVPIIFADYARAPLARQVSPVVKMIAIGLACAAGIGVVTSAVSARIEARQARQAMCVAKFEAWRARNPILAKGISLGPLADTCADYAALTGERL